MVQAVGDRRSHEFYAMAVRADNSFEFHTPPRDETKREKRLRIVASLLSVFNTMTVRDGHSIAHAVKDRLLARVTALRDVLVHIEPATVPPDGVKRPPCERRGPGPQAVS